jgi:hypothetical protein
MNRWLIPVVAAAVACCGPAPAPGDAQPGIRGEVVAGGTAQDPVTSLSVAGAQPLIVTGPLESDLRALAGATVVVHGEESGETRRTIRVESYGIVEINGERPVLGWVAHGDRLVVEDDTLAILGAQPGMEPGSLIWITGDRSAGQIRVGSWGVIRRSPR